MQTSLRKADARGQADFGWLQSQHSFSFGRYYDSRHMGYGVLRVINEDRVVPGKGFGTHSHQDMEILSYVIDGALEHKDSMGNGSIIRPGDLQRMSAGSGVTHSEFNASDAEPVHFLQIWILPERSGLQPAYAEQHFPAEERRGALRLIASREGREGSVSLNQDVNLYATLLDGDDTALLPLRPGRSAWVQVVRGSINVNGQPLEEGDGLAMGDTQALELANAKQAEVLVFDLPGTV